MINARTRNDSALRPFRFVVGALLLAAAPPSRADSPAAAPPPSYADLADLALAAPVAAEVRVVDGIPVKEAQAPGLRPGAARLFVEAEVVALLRSAAPLPVRVRYLADLPRDVRGRPPKLAKGSLFLVFAAPVAQRPGELRLVAPDAQLPFSSANAERLRAILREAAAPERPPVIAGVSRAFNVPGNIPGESETQIFLQSTDGRPVSLTVLRRPGETPRWGVALSEVVDESATAPKPETLLWYRLACGLPRELPPQSLSDSDAAGAAAIRSDYKVVLDSLGPCTRNRV